MTADSPNVPDVKSAPLSDSIVFAMARVVDDSKSITRFPSHSDIDFLVGKCGLQSGDPKTSGELVGKAKRVRGILSWALENDVSAGEKFASLLVSNIRSAGGFRESSQNYVGSEAITDAQSAFREKGFLLGADGVLQPMVLDSLSGRQLTMALSSYVERARKGVEDAALLTGTAKDLLEATAAHVLTEVNGTYSHTSNFPTLLGQAFIAVGFSTPMHPEAPGEAPQRKMERALYAAGCAVNTLRNKQGTGHGRPWLSTVSADEARAAVELMGTISGHLLAALGARAATKP